MILRPDNDKFTYSGRIDFEERNEPVFVYPASSIMLKVSGSFIRIIVSNKRAYWENSLGFVIDGRQGKVILPEEEKEVVLTLAENLEDKLHDVLIFKRQDSCHIFKFHGVEVEDGASIQPSEPVPERKIEVYGDSVSAGEVSEAVEYTGKEDPEHNGEYSNSYYSYAWMTARKLDAQIHNIAQGGIALLNGTGWFSEPGYIGMEEMYDKIRYHPELGPVKRWNFAKYRPHLVIVAIGQNDNHPEDYMAEDYESEKSIHWRKRYKIFVGRLRKIYPQAAIILKTTILNHHQNWDRAIEQVCEELQDSRIYHFRYMNNGCGTPGHIRIPEAERMSEELVMFIKSLGESVWKEEYDA
ncbi:electron transporter RnfD [Kineothrix sp. MB12-C1]|uniref:electron transporter RnfD n=1 Tax=Kineothrix sp. MB12-C1 TaxID=3070215 RepID=UPI0027D1F5F6|nr:electron transporter RnfD [Kineothrix sp. MB12-C1]WMC91545.1 electron transporter RnfD [Kineothrix sp. MB12-C1]